MASTSTATVDRLVKLDAPEKPGRRLPFSPWHLFLAPVAVIMLLPLETSSEAQAFPPVVLPTGLHFHNYVTTWNSEPFGNFFLNSAIYSLTTVAGNLLFCSLAAYAFARLKFWGRDVLFIVLLATLM